MYKQSTCHAAAKKPKLDVVRCGTFQRNLKPILSGIFLRFRT